MASREQTQRNPMKITISVIVIAVVVVAVIFSIRSLGEDVQDVRSGFTANQRAPTKVPENQVSVFDEEEWGRPIYSERRPVVSEEHSFETEYGWLVSAGEESTQFRCRGSVEVSVEGDVTIMCEGYANEAQSRGGRPPVTAEGTIEIGRLLSAYWELRETFPESIEVGAGRCGVLEWPP